MHNFFIILLILIGTTYSQCDTEEVEIWNVCYPIETTTMLYNTNDTFSEFPLEICSLINLLQLFCSFESVIRERFTIGLA